MRRAVRLLSVVAEVNWLRARPEPPLQGPPVEHLPWRTDKQHAADSESFLFANRWLLGIPHQVIRTAPVIALVEQLLDTLLDRDIPAQAARLATGTRRSKPTRPCRPARQPACVGRDAVTSRPSAVSWPPGRTQLVGFAQGTA